jgi:uncharacterized linocin/CFP29 family protein
MKVNFQGKLPQSIDPTLAYALTNIFTDIGRALNALELRGLDTEGSLIVDSDNGLILRSPNDHYWRVTVSNAGAIVTADLGTTKPTL